MIPRRGTVVVATDPFGDTSARPFVLVSDTTTGHPFPENECIAVVVTTTPRESGVAISQTFVEGGLPRESFASPWNPITLKEQFLRDEVGRITADTTDQIAREAAQYMRTEL